MKRIIVVLGMHRSGTSAIARGLQVFGVELGDRLIPPIENNNMTGFWEDVDINALNQEMLQILGNDWHYLAPIQADDIKILGQKGYFLRAIELLRLKIGDSPVWGFKDPRLTKLLPFWKAVFGQCQLETSYVLTLRHPLSVAKSLAIRDGFDAEKSYFLWLGHVIASLSGTTGEKRILIDYDRLLDSPDCELQRIASHLDLKIDSTELHIYKTSFLDTGLRHTVYDLNDLLVDDACPPLVHNIYSELLETATDKKRIDDLLLQKKIDLWADELERLKSPFILVDKLTRTITKHNEHIANLGQRLTEQDEKIVLLEEQCIHLEYAIHELYSSNSWKMTAPLRFISTRMKAFFDKAT